jgi:hypothetical protein
MALGEGDKSMVEEGASITRLKEQTADVDLVNDMSGSRSRPADLRRDS